MNEDEKRAEEEEVVSDLLQVLTMTPIDVLAGEAVNYILNSIGMEGADPARKWRVQRLPAGMQVELCQIILAGFSETAKLVEERDFKGARERLEKFMDDADAMLPNFPEGDIMQRTMEEDALAQLMTSLIGNLDFLEE
jgi:hypothetical protein